MLANSSQIILWALEKFIVGERPEMEVISKATSSADALRLAKEKQPDILLLGLYLGIEKSVDLIPDFVKNEHTRVLIFTEMREPQGTIDRAILNGASGVVYKEEPIQNILKAIEKIYGGELWLNRNTFNRILMKSLRVRGEASTSYDAVKTATLTRKERLIVNAFAIEAGERGPLLWTGKLMLLYQLVRRIHETYPSSYFHRRI